MSNKALFAVLVTACVAALPACSPVIDTRGNLADPALVDTIRIGQSNKQIVEELLGPPSTIAVFDKEVWFYIGQKTRTVSFFKPTVLDQRVVAIHFDEDAKVAKVARYGKKDAKEISPVSRVTPTKGKELTFIEQLIGNIGRFSTSDEDK